MKVTTPKTEIDSKAQVSRAEDRIPVSGFEKPEKESSESPSSSPDSPAAPVPRRVARPHHELKTEVSGEYTVPVPEEELRPGKRYVLKTELGRGGFAEVWESEQVPLWRRVAVKILQGNSGEGREQTTPSQERLHQERVFRLEALITASLEHPNIMPVYDMAYDDEAGRLMLAMKLIRGSRWDEEAHWDFNRLAAPEMLAKHIPILISVSQAVAYAHSRGIIHRDIKPSQIMLGDYGEVLLTDWGLAIAYDEELVEHMTSPELAKIIPNLGSAVNPAGTPAFMAPEQTEATAARVGPHTDIFMLGCCLYFILTGTTPFDASDPRRAFAQAKAGEYRDPASFSEKRVIPPEPARICRKAMAVDPKDRYATVPELIDDLRGYLSGASNRRDSLEIVEELRKANIAALDTYRQINDYVAKAEHAMALWPDNLSAHAIRRELMIQSAQLAVRHNDLVLASTIIERLETGRRVDKLREEIRTRETRLRWLHRQRIIFITATIILLVVATLAALHFYRQNVAIREKLEAAEDRAFATPGEVITPYPHAPTASEP